MLLDLAEQTQTKIWMTIDEVEEPIKELARELELPPMTLQARLSSSQMQAQMSMTAVTRSTIG